MAKKKKGTVEFCGGRKLVGVGNDPKPKKTQKTNKDKKKK